MDEVRFPMDEAKFDRGARVNTPHGPGTVTAVILPTEIGTAEPYWSYRVHLDGGSYLTYSESELSPENKPDSGPAFPVPDGAAYDGMNYRRWLAGQALIMAGVYLANQPDEPDVTRREIARRAWALADEIIATEKE